jgi:hypothetical protein
MIDLGASTLVTARAASSATLFACLATYLACTNSAAPAAASDASAPATSDAGEGAAASDAGAASTTPCTVPASCIGRFTLPGSTYALPYYSTFPLDQPNPQITDLVVFNQGLDRDAATDFSTLVTAAQMSGQLARTLVVTPHFEALANADGTPCTGNADDPAPNDLLWTCDGWSDGLAAASDPQATSYGALDALVAAFLARFPSVARVTISGFSAGGQLTQRYAAANHVDPGAGGTPFRYVIGDPSSYLYFDPRRPANASTCTPQGCPDGFPVYADAGGCPGYNDWKYGTDALEGAAASLTPLQLEQAYVGRTVTYLLGTLDDGPTTAADYSQLDVTCPAEAQGPFRFQRGLAFYAYAVGLLDAGGSSLFTVPGCAHSPTCVFQSEAGVSAVFGE